MLYGVIVCILWLDVIKALDQQVCTEESKAVKPGLSAVFMCNGPEDERAWLKDDISLKVKKDVSQTTDKRFKFYSEGSNQIMTITNVKQTDDGLYRCENTLNGQILMQQHLCVVQPARIVSHSDSDIEQIEGSTVDLWCNATFKSKVEWYIKDDAKEIGIGILGAKLEIRGITRHCPLTYTCNASNVYSDQVDSRIFYINVLFPPDLKISVLIQKDLSSMEFTSPEIQTGQDGAFIILEQVPTRVQINCTVYSNPYNITYWYFNDAKIASMDIQAKTENVFEDTGIRVNYRFKGIKESTDLYIFYMSIEMYKSGLGKYSCRSMNAHSANADTVKSMTIKSN